MKVTYKLLIANLKMTIRNRHALFWSLLFPLLFIGVFGLFDMEKGGFVRIAIVDQAQTETSENISKAIKEISIFNVQGGEKNEEEVKAEVKNGDLDFGLILPEELKSLSANPSDSGCPSCQIPSDSNTQQKSGPIEIKVYYDAKNVQNNAAVLGTLSQFITQTNLSLAQAPTVLTLKEESMDAKKIKYIEFIMTGMLGMSIMQYGIIGISIGLTRLRELNVLKKLGTTPLSLKDFVVSYILNYLLLGIVQTTIILAASHFLFQAQVYGSLVLLYGLATLGALIFLCFGFAIAGIAKSLQAAQGLAQVFVTPMMFLSGVFFSTELLPDIIKDLVQFLPLTPLLEALRKVALDEAGILEIKTQLIYLGIWLAVSFILAITLFRFSESKD